MNGIVQFRGSVIAALLLVFAKVDQVLWIDPITFAIAVVVLVFIKIPSVREHAEKSPFKKDFRDGLSYVRGSIDQAHEGCFR